MQEGEGRLGSLGALRGLPRRPGPPASARLGEGPVVLQVAQARRGRSPLPAALHPARSSGPSAAPRPRRLCSPHPSSPPPSSLGTPSTVLVYNYFYNTPVVMSAAVTQVRSSSASHVRGEGTSGLAQTPIASRLSVLTPTLTKHDVSCENTSAFPRHGLEAEGCACTPQAPGPAACSGGCSGRAPRAGIGAFLV